jgi:hypothetical protein
MNDKEGTIRAALGYPAFRSLLAGLAVPGASVPTVAAPMIGAPTVAMPVIEPAGPVPMPAGRRPGWLQAAKRGTYVELIRISTKRMSRRSPIQTGRMVRVRANKLNIPFLSFLKISIRCALNNT